MENKQEEEICRHYKYCPMKEVITRDCTKPAYENCKTFIFWKQQKEKGMSISKEVLGIGAIVNLESAEISTNRK